MLANIKRFKEGVCNLIVYTPSEAISFAVFSALKKTLGVSRDSILTVDNKKQLKEMYEMTLVMPLNADKWLVTLNADNFESKDIIPLLRVANNFRFVFCKTTKYGDFKRMSEDRGVKDAGVATRALYLGRLESDDIDYLIEKVYKVNQCRNINPNVIKWLKKDYLYEPQAVCDLLEEIKSGALVERKADVIRLIGIGGNNVESVVISLLQLNAKDIKSYTSATRRIMKRVYDLSMKYTYDSIRNFMLSALTGVIEIKELQCAGKYRHAVKNIPENYSEIKINRLRRFERTIMTEIRLSRCLLLYRCIRDIYMPNSELALLMAINKYVGILETEKDREMTKGDN